MPVIRVYGFDNTPVVNMDAREFMTEFRRNVGPRTEQLAKQVALVLVYSSATMVMSGESAPYAEIYADRWTPDDDLILLAKFVRDQTIVGHVGLDIEIIWADGTRNYFAKDEAIPDAQPTKR